MSRMIAVSAQRGTSATVRPSGARVIEVMSLRRARLRSAGGPLWAQMCKGRTDAKAVWSELIQAQDENGKPLFLGKDGKVTTTPTGAPLQFNAGGFIASTNALANDAK